MNPEDDWIRERTLWQRLPRKTLFKGFWLLVLLFGVFWFQAKSESCATTFTRSIVPSPPVRPRTRSSEGRTVQFSPGLVPPAKPTADAGAGSPAATRP